MGSVHGGSAPPAGARRLLSWILRPADRDDILGALDELFQVRSHRSGRLRAVVWYWLQVMGFLVKWPRGDREASLLGTTAQDLRFALRQLRGNKGFTAAAILVFAVGIGANVAMYSTTLRMLVQPLPFVDSDRLVIGKITRDGNRTGMGFVSAPDYVDYRERSTAFEALAALMPFSQDYTLTGTGEAERIQGAVISTNLFSTLGVDPQLGRGFMEEDGQQGAAAVALISDGLWKRRYGGTPSIVGQSLTIDGGPATVVGVMPAAFRFLTGADLWQPMRPDRDSANRRDRHNWHVIGRLAPGVTLRSAQTQVDAISAQLAEEYPETNTGKGMAITNLQDELVAGYRHRLFLLSAAVGALLLIACGNLTGMLLARAPERRTQLSVRAALGASRARLVQQMLVEALVLAVLGGVAGGGAAIWMQRVILAYLEADVPGVEGGHLSWPMFGLALTFTLVAGLAAGVYPALSASRGDLVEDLKEGSRASVGGGTRFRGGLVVVQVALSVALLIGSGLLLRSFTSVRARDPGFDPGSLLTAEIGLPQADYGDQALRLQLWSRLLERLRQTPGVVSAGVVNSLPVRGWPFGFEASSAQEPDRPRAVLLRSAMPGYLDAMRIRLLSGRGLQERDDATAPPVVVVSRSAARAFFGDGDPIGQMLIVDYFGTPLQAEVVGVADDVRTMGLEEEPGSTLYFPYPQIPYLTMQIAVRTAREAARVAPALRDIVRELDPNLPVAGIRTMDQVLSDSVSERRTIALSLTLLAAMPLLLAAFGLYAVLAHYVSRRLQELGIRMALGADGGTIGRLVLLRGARLIGAGLLLGLLGGLGATRLIRHLLFNVAPTDIPTLAGAILFVAVVAMVACAQPTWRAFRMNPMTAFRGR